MSTRSVFFLIGAALLAALTVTSVRGIAQEQGKPAAAGNANGEMIYLQRCATCHDGGAAARVPARETIAAMSVPQIVAALETGAMAVQGKEISAAEKQAVASFLSKNAGSASDPTPGACANAATATCRSSH